MTINQLKALAQKESTNPIIVGIISFLEDNVAEKVEKKVVAKKVTK
jgi:hypothetical protein